MQKQMVRHEPGRSPQLLSALCPGLPAASAATEPARTLGRVSGGVNPWSSAGFSPASGWLRIRAPLKSIPCSNTSGLTQEHAVGASKAPYSHPSMCLFVAVSLFMLQNQAGLFPFQPPSHLPSSQPLV